MKELFFSLIFLTSACFSISTLSEEKEKASVKTCELTVVINGLNNTKGKLLIGLANSKEQFMEKKAFFQKTKLKIKEKKVTYTFKSIPYGTYGVKVFHDENENGKLDTNFFGVPKEQYGASNNARSTLGPPKFEEAKFKVEEKKKKIEIDIK